MTTDPNSSHKRKANDLDNDLISEEEENPSPVKLLHKKHGEKDKDSNNNLNSDEEEVDEKDTDPNNKTLPTPPTSQQEDHKLSISSAKLALDEFNKNNPTKYVLIEDKTLVGNNFSDHRGSWTHCCFHAYCYVNASDCSIKQFFAEILTVHLSEPAVTYVILEGKTRDGCDYCPSSIIHPVDGYEAGCPEYSPRSPLSISDHAEDPLMDPNHETELAEEETEWEKEFGSAILRGSPPPRPVCHYNDWRGQGIRFGNLALDTYNKENNTKFGLIVDDTMSCNYFVCGDAFVHFIFHAVEDSTVQQFFTEIHLDYSSHKLVALCKMLEEGKTMMGCLFCTSFIHPVEGFQEGCPAYGPSVDDDTDLWMYPNYDSDHFVQKDKDTKEVPAIYPLAAICASTEPEEAGPSLFPGSSDRALSLLESINTTMLKLLTENERIKVEVGHMRVEQERMRIQIESMIAEPSPPSQAVNLDP